MSINQYEKKVYSQNGEDGILEEIFNRIPPLFKYFVEFGVENGLECNSRLLAEKYGWEGLMIEGDSDKCFEAKQHYRGHRVAIVNSFITMTNITETMKKNSVPLRPALLSVDIDGNDYWVLMSILLKYSPMVIVAEYNSNYSATEKWVMKYNPEHIWDGTDYQGASLTSLTLLCNSHNYALIGTDSKGVNAFFVHKDFLGDTFPELTSEQAYHPPRYYGHLNNGNYGHPRREGEHLKI